jgi:hypothetical protein
MRRFLFLHILTQLINGVCNLLGIIAPLNIMACSRKFVNDSAQYPKRLPWDEYTKE